MAWDNKKYLAHKKRIAGDLKNKKRSCYDFMNEYRRAVIDEDYELCKAITEILRPLGYDTADTHKYIERLNGLDR